MKKVLFVTSHLFSGSSSYFDILNLNHRIQGCRLQTAYGDLNAYRNLTNKPHKLNNSAAIWMDELMFNYMFHTDAFYYDVAKFIYIVREPISSINGIVSHFKYSPNAATRYYCYRLRRICEMAKRTPGAILLTWDDLLSSRFDGEVEKYLNLKTPIQKVPHFYKPYQQEYPDVLSTDLKEWAEDSYERHLHFMKNQKLRYWK